MNMLCLKLSLLILCLVQYASACSTIVAGPKATTDGSILLSHSNDGDGDSAGNLQKVIAKDYGVDVNRTVSRGSIPEVSHT